MHSPELDSEKGFITPSNTKDFDLLNKQEIRIPLYALDTSDTLEVLDFVKPYIPSKERLETSSFTNLPSQFDQLSKFSDRATNEFLSDKDLEKALKNEWRRAIRNNKPISLILFELQNNRKEKETLEKNKTLLMLIKQYLFRVGDLVVIYENNLVVILLPDTADYGLKAVISRLIKAIKVVYTQCIGEDFYLSIGQATAYPERKSDPDSLMSLAKESLRKQTSQNLALML
ncbi:MAG: diguanylate cyclase [Acidobacteria bacterium]|nr:diguanylate cyclase [Acidobacteriota bacterium]